jgi:hypothetical protein
VSRSAPEIIKEIGRDSIFLISEDLNVTNGAHSKQNLVYFISQSETGLARLCVKQDSKASEIFIEKGLDYVTSSFVHMKLQLFIRKKLHLLPFDLNPDHFLKGCVEDKENRLMVLKDFKRVYPNADEPVFKLLARCSAGSCFGKNIHENLEGFLSSMTPSPIDQEFLENYKTAFMLNTGEKDKKKITVENMAGEGILSIKTMYEAMSNLLEKHFSVNWRSSAFLGEFIYHFFITKIAHRFYSVPIQSKDSNRIYTLIYSHYTLSHFHETYNGRYYIVINILPPDTEINELGLYTKIMSVGVYIYKMFEYMQQCLVYDRPRALITPNKNTCYIFIGDIQSKVWPFNKLTK